MTQIGASSTDDSFPHAIPISLSHPHWFAAYTRANHEKCVIRELKERSVEYFLPLYRSVRRWSDRCVEMDLPLFPGYVFVRLALRDRLRVLQIPSVVRLLAFNGSPTALADEEIEILRAGLSERLRAKPYPFLMAGHRVRIKSGSLHGLEGILLRTKSSLRVVLSVALIHRSIVVDVDLTDVEEIPQF